MLLSDNAVLSYKFLDMASALTSIDQTENIKVVLKEFDQWKDSIHQPTIHYMFFFYRATSALTCEWKMNRGLGKLFSLYFWFWDSYI